MKKKKKTDDAPKMYQTPFCRQADRIDNLCGCAVQYCCHSNSRNPGKTYLALGYVPIRENATEAFAPLPRELEHVLLGPVIFRQKKKAILKHFNISWDESGNACHIK